MTEKKKKGTGLKYIPIQNFHLIPRYLFEQIEPLSFDIDRVYQMSDALCQNPFNILGVFADKENIVKGFMWAAYSVLDNKIGVHVLSIDAEFQGRGIVSESLGIMRKIQESLNAKGIKFQTTQKDKFASVAGKITELYQMEI